MRTGGTSPGAGFLRQDIPGKARGSALADILRDPDYFPDRIDPASGHIRFVATSRGVLHHSSFLDGRSPLGASAFVARIEDVVALAATDPGPVRWIFHTAFCGSTYLARLCDVRGKVLSLREPQVLVDLDGWRTRIGDGDRALYDAAATAVVSQLGKSRTPGETLLIKPSNWVNGALDDLWRPTRGDRAMVVASGPAEFLVAVLRGGRSRIEYTLRLADHLLVSREALRAAAARLLPATGEPMVRALRLALLAHWAQLCLFAARFRAPDEHLYAARLDYDRLAADGNGALAFVNQRLALALDDAEIAASVARHRDRHAKNDDGEAEWRGNADADRAVISAHGAALEEALRIVPTLRAANQQMIESLASDRQGHAVAGGKSAVTPSSK